ncbi:MAG: thioredoxin domain-containing protein [Cytophagales bacterium]
MDFLKISKITLRIFVLLTILFSCAQSQEKMHTNKLINESSPYLLQHAHNPVDWYPWGEEALKKAKDENKLLIISIGYSSCHWCHVMEHESFEDSAVAKLMNEHFVSIKVDREERPDIDQIYMEAAQLISGSGGWPLNAIALPDGRPIFAGTYFPKTQWMQLLQNVQKFYTQEPAKALEQAQKLTEGIRMVESNLDPSQSGDYEKEELRKIVAAWMPKMDKKWGGQDKAPKFPMPVGLDFLLQYQYLEGDLEVRQILELSLDKMAMGGIYDAVGGGFARYSTDRYWKVPHFEKMLYDNAQLVSLYSRAYQVFKKPLYKEVVYESLEFIEREMTGNEGQFYSAIDADSEGEEGKFYVWKKDEFEEVLAADKAIFNRVFNITDAGNWEHGNNVLIREKSWEELAKDENLSREELLGKWENAKSKLLEVREKRIRPGLDDKALTSWNALMMEGYIDAYKAFSDQKFLKAAIKNAEFLEKHMLSANGKLLRNHKDGKSVINAFLDDYALLSSAYFSLYQVTFEVKWLEKSKLLTDYALKNFSDSSNAMLFYTSSEDQALIARKKEVTDNVIPASNSVMAHNLFNLAKMFDEKSYMEKAEEMLSFVRDDLEKYGLYYSKWSALLIRFNYPVIELAISGKKYNEYRQKIDLNYLPLTIKMGSAKESELPLLKNKYIAGQTTLFVCKNKVCDLPVTEVEKALHQIRAMRLDE